MKIRYAANQLEGMALKQIQLYIDQKTGNLKLENLDKLPQCSANSIQKSIYTSHSQQGTLEIQDERQRVLPLLCRISTMGTRHRLE